MCQRRRAMVEAGPTDLDISVVLSRSEGAPNRRQPAQKRGFPRCIGHTKGGRHSKLHAVCDDNGRPVILLLTEGQASDHRGATMMLPRLPSVRDLIADRGYDSRPFRDALAEQDISACIPSTRSRKIPVPCDPVLYRHRHRIKVMFGKLKGWRRIAMRYDRCAHTFFGAMTLVATVSVWLYECVLSLVLGRYGQK